MQLRCKFCRCEIEVEVEEEGEEGRGRIQDGPSRFLVGRWRGADETRRLSDGEQPEGALPAASSLIAFVAGWG
jgi:hypothetical protein